MRVRSNSFNLYFFICIYSDKYINEMVRLGIWAFAPPLHFQFVKLQVSSSGKAGLFRAIETMVLAIFEENVFRREKSKTIKKLKRRETCNLLRYVNRCPEGLVPLVRFEAKP